MFLSVINPFRYFKNTWKIFLLLLVLFSPMFGQINDTEVFRTRIFYDNGDFNRALENGRDLLSSGRQLSPESLAFLHQYMALAFYNTGAQDSSRTHFLSLLSIRPDFEPDPVEVSPKIIEFFQQVKADFSASDSGENQSFTRYLYVEDVRVSAAWRSVLLPGWGQLHKQQKTRGLILGSAFWGTLAVTGYAWMQERDRKQSYEDAVGPENITTAYDDYNKWYRARRGLTIATAALWAIIVADANWSKYPRPALSVDRQGTLEMQIAISF